MCEKRTRKIKKGSESMRLREARRLQRMQRLMISSPSPIEESRSSTPCPCPPQLMDKGTQTKVMLHLAMRTVVLLQRNTLIQQKMIALQKETSDYVAAVMSHPENRRRYLEQVRLYGVQVAQANVLRMKPLQGIEHMKLKTAGSE